MTSLLEFTNSHPENYLNDPSNEAIQIDLDNEWLDLGLFDLPPENVDESQPCSDGIKMTSAEEANVCESANLLANFGFPYFRNSKGEGAPPVSHSAQMKEWGYQNVSFIKNQPFSPVEEDRIRRGVQELGHGTHGQIDWTSVWSSQSFQSTRTVGDLNRHWEHFLRPDVTRGSWSTEENHQLIKLVRIYEERKEDVNWQKVTSQFNLATGNNRTVFQCFKRYQSRYSSHRIMHWSDEDNATFLNFIGERNLTKKELFPWRLIRSYFPGRSWSAIYSHFNYHFTPPQQKGVKFDRSDDKLLLHAINSGLEDKQLEILFGYQRSINQIRNRIKTLRKNQSSAPGQSFVRKSKNEQMGLELIGLIKSVQTQDADQEIIDNIYNAATRHLSRRRHGRPRKSKLAMEDELRPMVRPLTFVNNKRPRKNCFPGDAREHGLILACLYRFLDVRFDPSLIPVENERTSEKLSELGIEDADQGSLQNLCDLVRLMPNQDESPSVHSSQSFGERKCKFMPPTLATFAGTRGLLLYTPALEMQAAGETTSFDEDGEIREDSPYVPEEGENLGDAHADQLLLFRLMVLFYWPQKALQQEARTTDAVQHHPPAQLDDVLATPPPKKKSRLSHKKR